MNALLIFPHQLFENNPLLSHEGDVYLIEEHLFFNQYNFHQQKIAFHRASMKFYEQYLMDLGRTVHYIEAKEPNADIRKLIINLKAQGITKIHMVNPVDDWLTKRIKKTCKQVSIQLNTLETPMFINNSEEIEHYFQASKKKFFQTDFYKQEREKRNILMDDKGQPLGGQLTYDVENRKRYPKGKPIVNTVFPTSDTFAQAAVAYTQKHFGNNIGSLSEGFNYSCDFDTAKQWLRQFLETRFVEFGDYEDAIVSKAMVLNHSLLTPMLNVGLLTPQYIIDQTLAYSLEYPVPLNSLEGFIRQILGWREFIRGVYVTKGIQERTCNYWGFKRKIPKSFYTGTTGIPPIDITIKKVLKTGYCHHIERLMVLGNFMVLCEFDPDEVYRWFMEMFIDAYDWVMVPNVYGMSQFADGGLMATKPYISGSNYLMKMSDYPKGEWQEIWDALFWRFMNQQRDFFLKNPRLGMLIKTFDKWDEKKRNTTLEKANKYLETMEFGSITNALF
ncbi:MAG TPA: cryptochrome/photolyase family protein [Bacteroidia bacterium]